LSSGLALGGGNPRLDREKLFGGIAHVQIPLFSACCF
jgi:hypothetical protein